MWMDLPPRRSEPCLDCGRLEKIQVGGRTEERWGHDPYAFVGCSSIRKSVS